MKKENQKAGIFYGWRIVAASFVLLFLFAGAGFYSFSIFIKPLEDDFGWPRASIALTMSIYFIIGGCAGPVVGKLIQAYGEKRIMLAPESNRNCTCKSSENGSFGVNNAPFSFIIRFFCTVCILLHCPSLLSLKNLVYLNDNPVSVKQKKRLAATRIASGMALRGRVPYRADHRP